jgi:hypothetical protein
MKKPVVPSEAQRSRGTSPASDKVFPLRLAALDSGRDDGIGRRALLVGAALAPLGARVVPAAPAAEQVTPALVEAAMKEG